MAEQRRVVFLHIAKTAGTTLRYLMRQQLGEKNIYVLHNMLDIAYQSDAALNRYSHFMGHIGYAFLARVPEPRFAFTFLRDPVDRVLSLYYYWRNQTPKRAHGVKDGPTLARAHDLPAFLELAEENNQILAQIRDTQTWQLFYDYPLFCRLKHRDVSEEEVLATAKAHLQELDFVGFRECTEASVGELADRLGWKGIAAAPRMRETPDRPRRESLDPSVLARIGELTQLDAALYAFAVDQLKPPL